ncbi:MAG: efflux RND transporter periplasmic adaptor subunit [Amphritea sp.]|nr:efflux RND transporter periplasmic adaptor subunit [Amphritea sp.]
MQQKHRWRPVILTALALCTIPLTLVYTDFAISNQPQPEQYEAPIKLPRVSVLSLQSGTYQSRIESYAEVRATDEVQLSSLVSGRVIWRSDAFRNGHRVDQGEPLLKLDSTSYQEAVANAQQTLASAELTLMQEQRQQKQARRDWQRSGIQEPASDLVLRKPQLKLAQSRVAAARLALKRAQRDLTETTIRAPFDAVVINRSATLGSYIEAGVTLATLRGSRSAEVELTLPSKQWQQLPDNLQQMEVKLRNPDHPTHQWQGQISQLSAVINPQTRQRSLTASVTKPLEQTPPLLSGSFVEVSLNGKPQNNLFAIPTTALTADGYIWTVVENRLQRHPATPLFSHTDQLYISSDNLPREIALVIKPLASYLPGMAVQAEATGVSDE